MHLLGDKFTLFLINFSCHCLRTVFLREARGTGSRVTACVACVALHLSLSLLLFAEKQFFTHPSIKSSAPARPNFRSIYVHSLKVHCLRHCRRITARLQLISSLHHQWGTMLGACLHYQMDGRHVESVCLPFFL